MRKFIKSSLYLKENFIENFIVRIILLQLLEFICAYVFATKQIYNFYLNNLYYILAFNVLYAGLLVVLNIRRISIRSNKIDYIVIVCIAFFCILNSFFYSESSIEGGHDQGTYLESAVLLSNTGSFNVNSQMNPYVYTYPGWSYYSNQITKHIFLPGNAVFLSIFYKLFGFKGIELANNYILFFSSLMIYFIVKHLKGWKVASVWLLIFLSNYYTIYFTRANYVENLQLIFTWCYIYLFVEGYRNRNFNYIIYAFIPLILLTTIRLEAILYIPIYFILLVVFIAKRRFEITRYNLFVILVAIVVGISIPLSLYNFDKNLFFSSFNIIAANKDIANGAKSAIPYNQQLFIWVNIIGMFTPVYLTFLLLSIFNSIQERSEVKKILLLIFILILPQFAFFLRPGIAFYLPWFVRRFWAVFMPFSLFFISSLIVENLYFKNISKRLRLFFTISIFVILILPGLSILFVKQGDGVMNFEKSLAAIFNKSDLIIFWDQYHYESYGPPLFFFFNMNVVYNRFPAYDKKTYAYLMQKYNNVYIITSITKKELLNHPYFQNEVSYVGNIESSSFLGISAACDTRQFIQNPSTFQGYNKLLSICSLNNPPTQVDSNKISLNIFKMDNNFRTQFIKENYDANFKPTNQLLK